VVRYEIRAATTEHLRDLCDLAQHLDTVNLPNEPRLIAALLEVSEASFSGAIADPKQRQYVFVLWDHALQRAVATSMILAQLGNRSAPYIYIEVRSEETYSRTLDRHFLHRVLTTRYSYDGPTELGGLVVHPEARRSSERLGTLIAYVRLLFIAMHREAFQEELLAELLPPLLPDGTSHLWEAYGRRFTGLSYREADRLSKHNKDFIRDLFPSEIHATLLPDEAQRVIGVVGAETVGVEKMLRRIGFRYAQRVDPFDGGPHFTCKTAEVTLIAAARQGHAQPSGGQPGGENGARMLAGRRYGGAPYFRAIPVAVDTHAAPLALSAAAFSALDLTAEDRIWLISVP
jgi:arginine N-succinyltransferase